MWDMKGSDCSVGIPIVGQMEGPNWSAGRPMVSIWRALIGQWVRSRPIVQHIEGSDWSARGTIVRQTEGSDWSAGGP